MPKLQFIALLTPSIGSCVLVILAWLHSSSRLTDLRDSVDSRFNSLTSSMNRQFDQVNRRFDEVNRRLGLIEADQKQFYAVTGRLDGRLDEFPRSSQSASLEHSGCVSHSRLALYFVMLRGLRPSRNL